jgi:hypothetical protein
MGIAAAGASIGGTVFPVVIRNLIAQVGCVFAFKFESSRFGF